MCNGKAILYHATTEQNAEEIFALGFRNHTEYFLGKPTATGVWFFSSPPKRDNGEVLLKVKLDMTERELNRWEWTGEGSPSRAWLIPAPLVNRRQTVELVTQPHFAEAEAAVC